MTNFPNSFLLNLWAVEVKGNIILFFDMCNISLLSPSVYLTRHIFPKAQAGTKPLYTQHWKPLFAKVERMLHRQYEHTMGKSMGTYAREWCWEFLIASFGCGHLCL